MAPGSALGWRRTTVTSNDEQLLAALDRQLAHIRTFVRGVAEGYNKGGFYLWGRGGTSKSFTVTKTLLDLNKKFIPTNSRLTAKGLFTLLREHPSDVHVLEDVETLFADPHSVGVLRSALGDRVVCWTTAQLDDHFEFEGGIIMVSNCDLHQLPQLLALKTRLSCFHYQPTNEQLGALMRKLARDGEVEGAGRLGPEKSLEVVDAILQRCTRLRKPLDLRLLVHALADRIQDEDGAAEVGWQELLDVRMHERVVSTSCGLRQQKNNNEREIARQIVNLPPQERLTVWEQATGKSLSSLYRCLRQAT